MPELSLEYQEDSPEGYELHQLKHLNNLQGKLKIGNLEYAKSKEEALEAKLADKEELTELKLEWYDDIEEAQAEVQADVFEGLCPPENIKTLTISGYNGSRYPSWMVGTQKSTMHLHKLKLDSCPHQPDSSPGLFFIPVSSLEMYDCWWDTLPYNMEDLESLYLDGSKIPSNMQHLTSLKRLTIKYGDLFFYEVTLPTLPSSLEYIEIIGGKYCIVNKIWEKIKDVPKKVIDGLTVHGAQDFPWTEDSSDEGCEATGSYESAGGSSVPEGSSGGSSAEEDSGATDMV